MDKIPLKDKLLLKFVRLLGFKQAATKYDDTANTYILFKVSPKVKKEGK